ncbi:right-handed parallel beta-helix repeat-containing protein [Zavarzinella formosa]|uniref:right-handed parallel beta-helix repeat-containing protein n=1 Tax=Zavarzinella formosa TaxID=360055 RepID=UPI000318EBB0|nr:right-handed parallel beta-helix repeat-containing protein [Zavarzinella formosa]
MSSADHEVNRRLFLGAAGTALALSAVSATNEAKAVERPAVKDPRATSGDVAVEPDWDEKLTLLVGPKKGQIVGTDEKAIQAAVDYVSRLGGGTVKLLEGMFKLRNSVILNNNVRLIGSGPDTILMKEPMAKSKLIVDSDWFDQEITVADVKGFEIGDGVCLRCRNPHNGGPTVIKRTIIAKSGNRLKLNQGLRENMWLMGESYAATLFPLVTGEYLHDLHIENLVIDGNKASNDNLDGNYAGCIFLQDCRNVTIKRVTARNNNGDGISWQICHDVTVEECHSHDHAGLGLHPGSGSQRPIMRGNVLKNNEIGLFFCWGVKYGLAERNIIEDNRVGISVGHRDTDNLIVSNSVKRSGRVGILFRAERGKTFAGHRNTVESNIVENTGGPESVAIDVEGETEKLVFIHNELREKREPAKRIGFRFGPKTGEITLQENKIEGFATDTLDQRKK